MAAVCLHSSGMCRNRNSKYPGSPERRLIVLQETLHQCLHYMISTKKISLTKQIFIFACDASYRNSLNWLWKYVKLNSCNKSIPKNRVVGLSNYLDWSNYLNCSTLLLSSSEKPCTLLSCVLILISAQHVAPCDRLLYHWQKVKECCL